MRKYFFLVTSSVPRKRAAKGGATVGAGVPLALGGPSRAAALSSLPVAAHPSCLLASPHATSGWLPTLQSNIPW